MIPVLERQRKKAGLCEFPTSLVYMVNPRPTVASENLFPHLSSQKEEVKKKVIKSWGEVVLCAKHLLSRHEDLSSGSRTHIRAAHGGTHV